MGVSDVPTVSASGEQTIGKIGKRKNVVVFLNNSDNSLIEVLSSKDREDHDDDDEPFVEALCVRVEPRSCSLAVKQLSSTFPLEESLAHLKRVRKRPLPSSESSPINVDTAMTSQNPPKDTRVEPPGAESDPNAPVIPTTSSSQLSPSKERPKKRSKKDKSSSKKASFVLELLVGTRSRLLKEFMEQQQTHDSGNSPTTTLLLEDYPILRNLGCSSLYPVMVPKYEPRSETEWKEHNQSWPTHYYPLKFDEHKEQQLALTPFEIDSMKTLMERCIKTRSIFIVDPNQCRQPISNDDDDKNLGIVSNSRNEKAMQEASSSSRPTLLETNPLATPILFAIQGVSRCERQATLGDSTIGIEIDAVDKESKPHDPQQQRRQYICTGYDMYSFYEPNIFEAMACLHSRLRRLVYFAPHRDNTGEENSAKKCNFHRSGIISKGRDTNNDSVGSTVWSYGISKHCVHHLPGTNHNFRAFEYAKDRYDN